jgi:hypothetical protein
LYIVCFLVMSSTLRQLCATISVQYHMYQQYQQYRKLRPARLALRPGEKRRWTQKLGIT